MPQECGRNDERRSPVGAIDPSETKSRLQAAERLSGTGKGSALEDLVADLFTQIPGCELVARRGRNKTLSGEIDLGFRLAPPTPFPGYFEAEMLVECKNHRDPVGPESVSWFGQKLVDARQVAGILVAVNGISGDSDAGTGALHEVDRLRREGIVIAVVDGRELKRITAVRCLVELVSQKLWHMRVFGRVWVPGTTSDAGSSRATAPNGEAVAAHPPTFVRSHARSFDARALTYEELAASFVASKSFRLLARQEHSLLIGPRGSGRSTLLRMLTPAALRQWSAATAESPIRDVGFTGIDVPPSVSRVQHLDPVVGSRLLVLGVAEAIVGTVERDEPVTLSDAGQVQLASAITHALGLKSEHSDLRGLRIAIADERVQLYRAVDAADIDAPVDLARTTLEILAAVNSSSGQPDHRWCLLFDEIELAGWRTVAQVLDVMKLGDPRLLVKAALLPNTDPTPFAGSWSPNPNYDYRRIDVRDADDPDSFLGKIADLDIASRLGSGIGVTDLLGTGSFDENDGTYELVSPAQRLAQEQAAVDPTVRDWLDGLPAEQQQPQARRAAPVLRIRSEFRHPDGSLRTGKKSALWTGAPDVLRLSDASPRMVRSVLATVLAEDDIERRLPVDRAVQARALAVEGLNMLEMLALADPSAAFSASDLVRQVGNRLKYHVLREPFQPDPPGCFVVDEVVGETVRVALRVAVNLNAICPVSRPQPREQVTYRLNYLLAAHFLLPCRRGAVVPLSRLLDDARRDSTR